MTATSFTHPNRQTAMAARLLAVAQAEAYLKANVGTRIGVAVLGRLVGLSERGLRNAFYGVHAKSPKQWMVAERLQRVRCALREPTAQPHSVTVVATHYGFYELGRFAGAYKGAFGEAPSDTLRNSRGQGDAGRQ